MTAPFAVRAGDSVELRSDVLVGRVEEFTDRDLPAAPVLVVEVASPSTALHHLNTKKAAYERLRVPSYWVIDPERVALTVYELREDRYHESATVVGDQLFDATRPYPVQVIPARLPRSVRLSGPPNGGSGAGAPHRPADLLQAFLGRLIALAHHLVDLLTLRRGLGQLL